MWRTSNGRHHEAPPEDRAPTETDIRSSVGRWIRAILAALAIQVGAVLVLYLAGFVYFLGLLSVWKTDEPAPWWIVFSVVIAAAAIALWIWSGSVAARITRSRAAWALLVVVPLAHLLAIAVLGSW